ncbi:hypothetical protein M9Y10_036642 [Tritrichomonas musculus]|uniref:Glycoside hydrolase family 5 domain-containing protein n=1 Tax=Tritrichomonas musculus TaxID=1915356 RepID=A0ABR2GTF2_9EUKA
MESDEDGNRWFPFSNLQYETSDKNEFDLSYLNKNQSSKIIIKEGHFVNEQTGERIRFFGTNVCFADAFPAKRDAPILAKRMAQLGINLVRFHHMDHHDIWQDNTNTILDPTKLDLLHYFLFCLHENGIYANINLHVSREYPEEEFTTELKSIFKLGKCLDRFYPPFIRDQIQYSINLLNSYNKYLQCKMAEDPMILNLELNNENTMFQLIQNDSYLESIKGTVFEKELEKQWNQFLLKKYKNKTENIENEWNKNETQIDRSTNLLKELQIGHQQDKNSIFKINKKEDPIEISIDQKPEFFWSNQIHFHHFPLEANMSYTIEFEAKATPKNNEQNALFVTVSFQECKVPYKCYAKKSQNVKLTSEFKKYSVAVDTIETTETKDKTSWIICKLVISPNLGDYTFKDVKAFRGKELFHIQKRISEKVEPVKKINNLLRTLKTGHQGDKNTKIEINKKEELWHFSINQKPQFDWSNQIHFNDFPIEANTSYVVEFEAKALPKPEERKDLFVSVNFQECKEPYKCYAVKGQSVNLTTEYKKYSVVIKSIETTETKDKTSSITCKLILSPHLGDYSFKNIVAYREKNPFLIEAMKPKYENNEIQVPYSSLNFPQYAHRDFRLFIQETETNTQKKLADFIRSSFPESNFLIVDSQASYGNILSYEREYEYSDFLDNHQYWQHPWFDEGFSWNRSHYSIQNTPMFSECKNFGTFKSLKMLKPFDKPYTISEYNHPFPNDHLHEKFPMFGSWAAFHDWDAIYQFSFDEGSREINFINGYFSMSTNPIDFAFAPFIALSFRKSYVSTSKDFVHVKIPKSHIQKLNEKETVSVSKCLSDSFHAGWASTFDIAIIDDPNINDIQYEASINMNVKDKFVTDEIVWDGIYKVFTPKLKTITGFIGNSEKSIVNDLELLNIQLKLNENLKESATVGIVSLDDKNLLDSQKILMVVAGKVKNKNQKWNKERKSTGRIDQGANWGSGPSYVQYIEFDVVFNITEKNKPDIWTINNVGEKKEKLKIEEFIDDKKEKKWKFSSDHSKPSLSFLIERKV